jgi:hypothetical protein
MRRGASHQPIFSSSMSRGDATILTLAAPLERWRRPSIGPGALKPSTARIKAAKVAHLSMAQTLLKPPEVDLKAKITCFEGEY